MLRRLIPSFFAGPNRGMGARLCAGTIAIAFILTASASRAGGQSPAPPEPTQPAPPAPDSSSRSSSSSPSSSSSSPAAPPANAPENYNPLPAEKDVEVATFYMKKGDADAAVPRLQEAIQLKPNYAKPYLMLGEIYEKKGDRDNALKYYHQYLQVFPHASDAKKVQEKISKLSSH
jgi:tetratricopeptide (TPR) repeat protein